MRLCRPCGGDRSSDKAVATVSGADIGRQFRNGAEGDQDPAVMQVMLDAASAARTVEARGEGVQRFPIFPATEQEARAGGQHTFEGWDYFCTDRAQHHRSAKEFTWTSIDRIVAFDAFRAVTGHMTIDAIEHAREPKRLHWIDGASHVDLYDKDEYVTPTVAELTAFFAEHLAATEVTNG